MFKKKIYLLFLFIFSLNLYSKPLDFNGLFKLNLNDIQSITSKDIFNNSLEIADINSIMKELILSDLIYDINYQETNEQFKINIIESNIVENIYFNNNKWITDDLLSNNLVSQKQYFLLKDNVKKDIEIIRKLYTSNGFQDIFVSAKIEKYSEDRINLIFDITENYRQKINQIKFVGNNFFSNTFLNSKIKSQSLRFYNIFKSGSNLNYSIFEFDKNNISTVYKNSGFLDAKVSYSIKKNSFNTNTLYFYIEEGDRYKIKDIEYIFDDQLLIKTLNKPINNFEKNISKNKYFYDNELITEYSELLNLYLIDNNIFNKLITYEIIKSNNSTILKFSETKVKPRTVNKINITGNSITKEKTIRSKILIEPGDYFNRYTLDKSINTLKKYPYINNVNTSTDINNQLIDIDIKIDEELKTGNLLLAGTFNDDTGLGLNFGIEDKNIFGSGNSINSNFFINSEDLRFEINYKQYPIFNPNFSNTYSIYNQENDFTKSYGYKASTRGLGYFINFDQDDKISYGTGISYESFKGHSGINNTSVAINENIGNFENYKLNFSIVYDDTNDFFYPTNGMFNRVNIEYSPNEISDNSFYKIVLINKNYKKLKKSENYFFLNNTYGYAKSLNAKLKTIDSFGLGGMNFKGFDYNGIGPYDGNVYLGGNEFFTSTLGYGSSFIFDDKDNINIKLFTTFGSIWNSDYATTSNEDIRASIGTSFDFITALGPISFSYAVPIEKNNSDRTRPFNFSIGTSF